MSVHRGGGLVPGGGVWSPIFRGGVVSNFSGGVVSNFLGGSGLQLFGGGVVSNFSGGGVGLQPEYGQRSASTHPTGMHSCH